MTQFLDPSRRKDAQSEIKPDGILGQLWTLSGIVRGLQHELAELRRWHNKAAIRGVVEEVYGEDVQHLEELRDSAVRVLSLLVEKGLITQDEKNEATRGD